jgi:dihydroorotase
MTESSIEIIKPDDWHVHLRDADLLKKILPFTYRNFKRALIMPNLIPPLTRVQQVEAYYASICANLPKDVDFKPLMTMYLSQEISKPIIEEVSVNRIIKAIKMYPKGATTNSEFGVSNFKNFYHIFEAMEKHGVVLCIHGEVTDEDIDIFDREKVFLETVLEDIIRNFPNLKIVIEHITSKVAVEFVAAQNQTLSSTITIHHLLLNRNQLLSQKIRPHFYCAPILKTEQDRQALIKAATSGSSQFFLGTDSAPHAEKDKITDCGCAGIFSSPVAIEYLVQLFSELGKLDKLESFTSVNGALFYGEPVVGNKVKYVMKKKPRSKIGYIKNNADKIWVFDPGIDLYWGLEG